MSDTVNPASATRIALSPVLDRAAVAAHLDEFRAAFASASVIEVGCEEVRQIGQSGLQLLASALRTGRDRAVEVRFVGVAAIEPVIRLAGMTDLFLSTPVAAEGGIQ